MFCAGAGGRVCVCVCWGGRRAAASAALSFILDLDIIKAPPTAPIAPAALFCSGDQSP